MNSYAGLRTRPMSPELRPSACPRWSPTQMPREKRREWDKAHTWDLATCSRNSAAMALNRLKPSPEEYGGQGEDIYAAAAVIEELCQGGVSKMAGPVHPRRLLWRPQTFPENGSEGTEEALLPKLARGRDVPLLWALSEPNVRRDLPSVRDACHHATATKISSMCQALVHGHRLSDYIYCLCRSGGPEDAAR